LLLLLLPLLLVDSYLLGRSLLDIESRLDRTLATECCGSSRRGGNTGRGSDDGSGSGDGCIDECGHCCSGGSGWSG
ncbi:hypothetical protein PENTCL1PPCAC_11802, partial [Pristionchus entomophagus]